jgi:uncharacterized membrane protein HdeD (DUF308 family)
MNGRGGDIMFRKIVFYDNFTDAVTGTWSTFLVQGIILILLGLLIYLFPEILVVAISATFIALGLLFIGIALKTKGLKTNYRTWRDEFWDPS